jgi:hypothetical protein
MNEDRLQIDLKDLPEGTTVKLRVAAIEMGYRNVTELLRDVVLNVVAYEGEDEL